jgi:hypothetical protein
MQVLCCTTLAKNDFAAPGILHAHSVGVKLAVGCYQAAALAEAVTITQIMR